MFGNMVEWIKGVTHLNVVVGMLPECKDLAWIKLPLRWLMREIEEEEEEEVWKNICRENFKHNFRERATTMMTA